MTSLIFTERLKSASIAISMDGRGHWVDSVFVERLCRSVKYEEVCLRPYEPVRQAREGISRYLSFYNAARPHTARSGKTTTTRTTRRCRRSRKRPAWRPQ